MYRPSYLLLLSVWGGGRGADAPKIGMKYFFSWVSQSRALNKEQCPIYWRVVLMMIRLALCSLNVVGMYLKFDFRCRCTICFLSFDFVQCQYVHATDLGLGDLLSSLGRNKNYTLCARDIFLLVSLFGFKLNILVK